MVASLQSYVHNCPKMSAHTRSDESSDILPATQEIPNKLYFRIGEVSKLAGVKPYVLRYWETEFAQLRPKKSGTNQRLYPRKEVELILEIKHLLYEKRFTIEGARKALDQREKSPLAERTQKKSLTQNQATLFTVNEDIPRVQWEKVRAELRDLLKVLGE